MWSSFALDPGACRMDVLVTKLKNIKNEVMNWEKRKKKALKEEMM